MSDPKDARPMYFDDKPVIVTREMFGGPAYRTLPAIDIPIELLEAPFDPKQDFKFIIQTLPFEPMTPEESEVWLKTLAEMMVASLVLDRLEPNQFQCAQCRGVFNKGRPDEDAAAELGTTFPGATTDGCALVCDDCFKAMGLSEDEPAPGWEKP